VVRQLLTGRVEIDIVLGQIGKIRFGAMNSRRRIGFLPGDEDQHLCVASLGEVPLVRNASKMKANVGVGSKSEELNLSKCLPSYR
jgi:hypothetical protein